MRKVLTHLAGAVLFAWMSIQWPQAAIARSSGSTSAMLAGAQDERPAPAAEQHITGEVIDRDGKPVENAEVVFSGPKKQSVRTGARGEFSFAGPAGEYDITVNAGARHKTFPKVKIENNQLKPMSTLTIDRE